MAKYELIKTTDVNGEIWYNIKKDGYHVNQSFTKDIDIALEMLEGFEKGKQSEPIIEVIKTLEIDD
jgi:hypothetical protein